MGTTPMKMPVTDSLVSYLHSRKVYATDIIRRGVPRDCVYRIFRRDIEEISEDNAERLAASLGLDFQQLMAIAVQDEIDRDALSVADGMAPYSIGPPAELRPLLAAWPHLCDLQRQKILAYVQAILDVGDSKNLDCKAS